MNTKGLLDFSREELENKLVEKGFKAFNGRQIFQWIYQKHEFDPSNWSNIPKALKTLIEKEWPLKLPKIVYKAQSKDKTLRLLMGLVDGQAVEAVLIPAKGRLTLCLSSQVGCAIGCTFCHTGTLGLTRNLTVSEVVGQYLTASQLLNQSECLQNNLGLRISNIVYMGQGEPLHNYTAMKKATEIFLDDLGPGLGQRRITLSTSGLVPQIEKLEEFPSINVAISLHAVRDDLRSELMPINKLYDLQRLFSAIKKIPLKAHRRITYEYLLIKDRNMGPEDVEGLVRLLPSEESKINLIPFNEYPGSEFKRPSDSEIKWFQSELMKRGYVCTVRISRGDDVMAACGQLKSFDDENKARTVPH